MKFNIQQSVVVTEDKDFVDAYGGIEGLQFNAIIIDFYEFSGKYVVDDGDGDIYEVNESALKNW